MSRGDHHLESAPFRLWHAKVDRQKRLRVPSEIRDVVTWLSQKSGGFDCIGSSGIRGCVQIEPAATYNGDVSRFAEAVSEITAVADDPAAPLLDAARLLANGWHVVVSIERHRISLTLPEPARIALNVDVGSRLTVFGFRDLLEVWPEHAWRQYIAELGRRSKAVEKSLEDVDGFK